MAGTEPPCWKVQFDDGELRDDIWLVGGGVACRWGPHTAGYEGGGGASYFMNNPERDDQCPPQEGMP